MILWVKDKTLVDTTEPLVPNFSLPPYLIITIHPHKNAIKVPSFLSHRDAETELCVSQHQCSLFLYIQPKVQSFKPTKEAKSSRVVRSQCRTPRCNRSHPQQGFSLLSLPSLSCSHWSWLYAFREGTYSCWVLRSDWAALKALHFCGFLQEKTWL